MYYFYISGVWDFSKAEPENKPSKEALPSPFLYVSIWLSDIFSFLAFTFTQTKGRDFIHHYVKWGMKNHLGIPVP